jgi:hypothetical protein
MRRSTRVIQVILSAVLGAAATLYAQQPAQPGAGRGAAPAGLPPLFFREEWKQIDRPADAPADFVPERGVTAAAVTNQNLELRLYDPNAKSVPAYLKQPPTGSIARDWSGPACIQLAGYNQSNTPTQVAAGQPTDPPNLWTGVCQTPVAATLRDKNNFADLTGLARIRWVTRTSGFHVVRPVVKLADGTWLVGDRTDGTVRDWLYTEFSFGDVRWMKLDINRAVTTGTILDKVDLSKVDEIGFVDLMPGSGHGQGGWVDVAQIEVYANSATRTGSAASQ